MMYKSIQCMVLRDKDEGAGSDPTPSAATETHEPDQSTETQPNIPEGFTVQEWNNLTPGEQSSYGISDESIESQESGEPSIDDINSVADEEGENNGGTISDNDENTESGDKKSDGDIEEGRDGDKSAATTDTSAKPDDQAPQLADTGDLPTDEDLLAFRPVISDSEIPIPEDVPQDLQGKLDALDTQTDKLDEWFTKGEDDEGNEFGRAELRKAEREIDKERQAINRQITAHQITRRDVLREDAVWKQEQTHFLNSRPNEYAEKDDKGNLTDRSQMLYGALANKVNSLLADPANKNKSGIQILVAADKAVRKAFNIPAAYGKPAALSDKPANTKPADVKPKPPPATLPKGTDINLSTIPQAGQHDTDPFAHIDAIADPYQKEQAIMALNDRQRDAYLNSAR